MRVDLAKATIELDGVVTSVAGSGSVWDAVQAHAVDLAKASQAAVWLDVDAGGLATRWKVSPSGRVIQQAAGDLGRGVSVVAQPAPPTPVVSRYDPQAMMGQPRQPQAAAETGLPLPATPFVYLVANTKGGSGKTPLAVLLASAFGQLYPNQSLLVDIDPTGNLAARAGFSSDLTLLRLSQFLTEDGDPHRLAAYLGRSAGGEFLGVGARTTTIAKGASGVVDPCLSKPATTSLLTEMTSQFRIIGLDAGNNDADETFLAALPFVSQLVIPVRWDKPTCIKAAEVLRSLDGTGHSRLARQAVIVATHSSRDRPHRNDVKAFRAQYDALDHEVFDIPPDRHIDHRGEIVWGRLASRTQNAAMDLAKRIMFRHQRQR